MINLNTKGLGLLIPQPLLVAPTSRSSEKLIGRYVGFWRDCNIALCRLQFRLRRLSGRVAETLGRPSLTPRLADVGQHAARRARQARAHPPLRDLLPKLGAAKVLEGLDAEGEPRLRPPKREKEPR